MDKVLLAIVNRPSLFIVALVTLLALVSILASVPLLGGEVIVKTPGGVEVQMSGPQPVA